MAGVRVAATKGSFGRDTFYAFTTSARHLLKLAFVNHQALNHPDSRPTYQRMISKNRIRKLSEFIAGGGYFPTNILINFTEKCRFDPIPNQAYGAEGTRFGWLHLPSRGCELSCGLSCVPRIFFNISFNIVGVDDAGVPTELAAYPIWLFGVSAFVILCATAEAGYRLQRWLDRPSSGEKSRIGVGQLLGVTLGLMSLLLSFTFSIAVTRHDARRVLVEGEANAIGTAWLRADLAAEPYRTALEQTLRDYVQVRVGFYAAGEDEAKLDAVEQQTAALQRQLTTSQVVRTAASTEYSIALMQAMNDMFDHAPDQKTALAGHVPIGVLTTLSVLLLASALMMGAVLGDLGQRHLLMTLMLLAVLSAVMTLIIDVDRPRLKRTPVNPAATLDLRQTLLAAAEEK